MPLPRRFMTWMARSGSLVAVDDAATVQVVRAQLDDHAVLGKDADVMLAHLPGDVREHHVAVVELHPETRIRKRLRDRALDLDHAVLLGHASPISILPMQYGSGVVPCTRQPGGLTVRTAGGRFHVIDP